MFLPRYPASSRSLSLWSCHFVGMKRRQFLVLAVSQVFWELTLLCKAIYAKAGNTSRKKWLADYFRAQPWYHQMAATDGSKLSAFDRRVRLKIVDLKLQAPPGVRFPVTDSKPISTSTRS
jgi:hypothetical protein